MGWCLLGQALGNPHLAQSGARPGRGGVSRATRRHAAAQHRLDTASRRQLRNLCRDFTPPSSKLERAENLAHHPATNPPPPSSGLPRRSPIQRDAHDRLRNCDTIDRLRKLTSVGEQRLRPPPHHLAALGPKVTTNLTEQSTARSPCSLTNRVWNDG